MSVAYLERHRLLNYKLINDKIIIINGRECLKEVNTHAIFI